MAHQLVYAADEAIESQGQLTDLILTLGRQGNGEVCIVSIELLQLPGGQ